MSAIFGIWNRDGDVIAPDSLENMDRALAGLGPDAKGLWQQGAVGMGHRLMRFSPEDIFDRQPSVGAEGKLVLVCDGRIDNRPDLARALGIPSAQLRLMADSALVLSAYEKWREDCVRQLVGTFAFALWDERRGTLFLARSQFSAVPLYYLAGLRVFAFASMPRGLFALPFVHRSIDEAYLADYLVSFPADPGRCFYDNIRMLSPGHCLLVSQGQVVLRKFWSLDDISDLRLGTDGEYVEAARALIDQVIADQLRSDSPVTVMMSGGLDSTTVAGTAATLQRDSGNRLGTFTEVPSLGWQAVANDPGRYLDESPLVMAMARHHGNLDPHFVHGDGFYLEGVEGLFEAAEVPFRNASNRHWWESCLSGAASRGSRVMLTGNGGNLSLGWNGGALLSELIRSGRWIRACRSAGELVREGTGRSVSRGLAGGAFELMPLAFRRARNRRRLGGSVLPDPELWRRYSAISEELVRDTRLRERGREKGFNFEFAATRSSRRNRLMGLQYTDSSANLDQGYRRLFGVDLRHPLCDKRLVEFSLSVPEDQFQHQGVMRSLMRRAMSDRVPAEILENKGRGVQGAQWLQRLIAAREAIEVEMELLERSPLVVRALDIPRLRQLVRDLPVVATNDASVLRQYRLVFEFGMMTGRFLRWVDGWNQPTR